MTKHLFLSGTAGEVLHRLSQADLALRKSPNFLKLNVWMRARYDALKKHCGGCLLCGERGRSENRLNVDHILPRARFPELALMPWNLQVLCARCNLGKGNRDATDWRRGAAASPESAEHGYTPTDDVLEHVRRLAPDCNPDELLRRYNNWCSTKTPARNPHGAFIGWVKKVIEGTREALS